MTDSVKAEAQAFRIWREGKPVNWDCSVAELADATGMRPVQVRQICKQRGWPVVLNPPKERGYVGRASHHETTPVDRFVRAA